MNMNLIMYYEARLERYLNRIFSGSIPGSSAKNIEKILELYTNVLKAKSIDPSGWTDLANKVRQSPTGFMQFIQVDHLLEMTKQAIALLDPNHPAAVILKTGLANHASKISDQQRANASNPRKTPPYKRLLTEIISSNINISEKELLKALKKVQGNGVIDRVDDFQGIIYIWDDEGRESTAKINGLKDHLRKIKDKLI